MKKFNILVTFPEKQLNSTMEVVLKNLKELGFKTDSSSRTFKHEKDILEKKDIEGKDIIFCFAGSGLSPHLETMKNFAVTMKTEQQKVVIIGFGADAHLQIPITKQALEKALN